MVFAANVTDNVSIGGAIGNVFRNAPNIITIYSLIITIFGLLFAAAFFNNSALRDHKNNFQEILFSKPIDKFGYFMGKFLASLFLSTVPLTGVFFGIILGSKVAPLMGWIEADRFGPFFIETFINNYFIFILPNMFIGGAIIYSLAQEYKNTMISFVGAMLIIVGYSIARINAARICKPFIIYANRLEEVILAKGRAHEGSHIIFNLSQILLELEHII